MTGSLDLQKAVYDLLSNDAELTALMGDLHLYDVVPDRARFPYIAFGASTGTDWSTSDEFGTAIIFTLNCWSKANGRKELYHIADRISQALQAGVNMAAGADTHLVLISPISERFENVIDARTLRATLRFRALIEPAQ